MALKLKIPFFIALAYTVAVGFASLAPVEHLPVIDFSFSDKALHAAMYFFMLIAWVLALKNYRNLKIVEIAALVFCFGTVIEVLQGVLPFGRSFDLFDVLANVTGIFIGMVIRNKASFFKR